MDPSSRVTCPDCNTMKVQARGRNRYQCMNKNCKKNYFTPRDTQTSEKITQSKNAKELSRLVANKIRNEQDLIAVCEIDTQEWEIEKWTCEKKDRLAQGEIKVLFEVKVWLTRKVNEMAARDVIAELIEDARKFAPKYPKMSYPKRSDGLVYEIDLADLHFGKLTWAEETGQDYDIQIAADAARKAVAELLGFVKPIAVDKILLPIGNDFFNVNGAGEFTVNGTRQIEDTRWQKTFREGRKLLVELIDMCSQAAPVDVLVVPGNHDRERMFYAGDALECWYHSHQSVLVNNGAQLRKYYSFGKNMILFTHGSEEKFTSLPGIMALEEPAMWGRTTHREAHVGDRHHKESLQQRVKETLEQRVKEIEGVTIRLMRSLSPTDEWHYRTGWVGAEQAAESYLWHPENGVIGQFTSVRRPE